MNDNWKYINSADDLPPEGLYVLVKFDNDFVSISRIMDEEWEMAGNYKHPIYHGYEKVWTSSDPQYWKYIS